MDMLDVTTEDEEMAEYDEEMAKDESEMKGNDDSLVIDEDQGIVLAFTFLFLQYKNGCMCKHFAMKYLLNFLKDFILQAS